MHMSREEIFLMSMVVVGGWGLICSISNCQLSCCAFRYCGLGGEPILTWFPWFDIDFFLPRFQCLDIQASSINHVWKLSIEYRACLPRKTGKISRPTLKEPLEQQIKRQPVNTGALTQMLSMANAVSASKTGQPDKKATVFSLEKKNLD